MTALAVEAPCSVSTRLFGELTLDAADLVRFPDGLPGFPSCQTFALLPTVVGALAWLQSVDRPELALLLVQPEAAGQVESAVPEPLRREGLFTGLVVTLPGSASGSATANLQAPIVVDRATGTGRQVILPDSRFGVTHPFDLQAVVAAAA